MDPLENHHVIKLEYEEGNRTRLSDICQTCLANGCNTNLYNMMEVYEFNGKTEVYSEMLGYCLSINMTGDSKDSENICMICDSCVKRLREVSIFKSQVETAQETIKLWFDPTSELTIDVPSEKKDSAIKVENVTNNTSDDSKVMIEYFDDIINEGYSIFHRENKINTNVLTEKIIKIEKVTRTEKKSNENEEKKITQNHLLKPSSEIPTNEDDKHKELSAGGIRKRSRLLRTKGKEYVGYTRVENKSVTQNILRPAKCIKERCKHKSPSKLTSKSYLCDQLSENDRQFIFDHFWNLSSWDLKKAFVTNLVQTRSVRRRRQVSQTTLQDKPAKKTEGHDYFLKGVEGKRVKVCRLIFLNTLSLGEASLKRWVKDRKHPSDEFE